MQITIDISDEVAAKAQAAGLSVETFVQKAAERAAEPEQKVSWVRMTPGPYTPEEAGRNIRELSKGLTLGEGLTVKDLINEGRKY
jgi:anthranilate/para-aminobenzoate synthase component II